MGKAYAFRSSLSGHALQVTVRHGEWVSAFHPATHELNQQNCQFGHSQYNLAMKDSTFADNSWFFSYFRSKMERSSGLTASPTQTFKYLGLKRFINLERHMGCPAGLCGFDMLGPFEHIETYWNILKHIETYIGTYWNMTPFSLQNMQCQRVATYVLPLLWYRKPPWMLDQWQNLVVTACSV